MNEREKVRMAAKVVRLRNKQGLSWAEIGEAIEHSAGTARRLYDFQEGEGAHVGLLPGKGGRLPARPAPRSTRNRTRKRVSA